MIFGKNIKTIVSFIGLLAIIWLIFNNSIFIHWHQKDNGTIIIHAHPFNKSAEDSGTESRHTHDCKDFVVISVINSILLIVVFIIALNFFSDEGMILNSKLKPFSFLDVYLEVVKARPPPFIFFKTSN